MYRVGMPQWYYDPRLNTYFRTVKGVTEARRADRNREVFPPTPTNVSDVSVEKVTAPPKRQRPKPKPTPTPMPAIPAAKEEPNDIDLERWWNRISDIYTRLEGERFAREREAFDRGAAFNTARDVFGLFGGIVRQGMQ